MRIIFKVRDYNRKKKNKHVQFLAYIPYHVVCVVQCYVVIDVRRKSSNRSVVVKFHNALKSR